MPTCVSQCTNNLFTQLIVWDDTIEGRFNFVRFSVTGYGLYRQESQYVRLASHDAVHRADKVTEVRHILHSLSPKHVGLFIMLLQHRLNEHKRITTEEDIRHNKSLVGMSLEQIRQEQMKKSLTINDQSLKTLLE